jgi:hypothetical protein
MRSGPCLIPAKGASMHSAKAVLVMLLVVLLFGMVALPVLADGGGNNTVIGQDYTLKAGERLADNLVVVGGRVHLEADSVVEGDVVVMGGEANFEGLVQGDVVAFGGTVTLASTAVIQKDLVVFGSVRRDAGAQIKGNLVEGLEATKRLKTLPNLFNVRPGITPAPLTPPVRRAPQSAMNGFLKFVRDLVTLVAVLFVAALVAVMLPDNLKRVNRVMLQFSVFSMGIGLLTIVVVALAMGLSAILVLICVGVPLLIVLGLAFLLAALMGWVAAGKLVGEKVLQMLHVGPTSPLGEIVVGTLLLTVLSSVQCIGWLVTLVALSWGLGAVVLTRFGTQPYVPSATMAPFGVPPVPPTPPAPPVAPQPSVASQPQDGGLEPGVPGRRDTKPLDESLLNDDPGTPPGQG